MLAIVAVFRPTLFSFTAEGNTRIPPLLNIFPAAGLGFPAGEFFPKQYSLGPHAGLLDGTAGILFFSVHLY